MKLQIRTGFGTAILVCAWSCQTWGKGLATLYSAALEPDGRESRLHDYPGSALPLALPVPVAWSCRLDGGEELRREVYFTYQSMLESSGAPAPSLDFNMGGMPGPQERSFFHMAARGSAVIVGAELAMMGVMMLLPRSTTKWQDDFVQDAVRNMGNHIVSAPVWDQDNWRLNYIGHPVAGSIYYNTVRAQGASPWQSFLFALGASTFWEYFVEATAEPASTQDLIITPVGGALLGELAHRATLEMKKGGTSLFEGVLITLINPTHVIMQGYH